MPKVGEMQANGLDLQIIGKALKDRFADAGGSKSNADILVSISK